MPVTSRVFSSKKSKPKPKDQPAKSNNKEHVEQQHATQSPNGHGQPERKSLLPERKSGEGIRQRAEDGDADTTLKNNDEDIPLAREAPKGAKQVRSAEALEDLSSTVRTETIPNYDVRKTSWKWKKQGGGVCSGLTRSHSERLLSRWLRMLMLRMIGVRSGNGERIAK